MRRKVTAFLLSALVFPGLGHLYIRERRKGVILLLAANVLLGLVLLTLMLMVCREYTLVFYPRPPTTEMAQQLLLDTVRQPLFWLPAGLLAVLWSYAAVDAVLRAGLPASEQS